MIKQNTSSHLNFKEGNSTCITTCYISTTNVPEKVDCIFPHFGGVREEMAEKIARAALRLSVMEIL